ncbi:MAG: hypothetical protein RBT74_13225 [Tenuifilaceae bacterium]|jgi:hypothetical protein|nr:hypothetical protein [Tenuifilaceae bacterium]
MNSSLRLVFLLAILSLLSCKEQSLQEKHLYYEDGSIRQIIQYTEKYDTTTFRLIEFLQNGDTLLICDFKNNAQHGLYKGFYPNNMVKVKSHYQNGKQHGLTRFYIQNSGFLTKEILYIEGKPITHAIYGSVDDTLSGISYYYSHLEKENDTLSFFGSLSFNTRGELVDLMSSYFLVNAEEKVKAGEPLLITIKFVMGLYNDIDYELQLGDFNKDLAFTDSSKVILYKSTGRDLSFEFKDYNYGYNLILGKIKLYKSNIQGPITYVKHPYINEYFFYHQFEVIK